MYPGTAALQFPIGWGCLEESYCFVCPDQTLGLNYVLCVSDTFVRASLIFVSDISDIPMFVGSKPRLLDP